MKHEVTSLQTKKLLASALKTSMEKKPFSKVTVNELIMACGVNRNTFYYHFDDIYALLKWMLEQETVEVLKQFDLMTNYEGAVQFILTYVEENQSILSCTYDALGQAGLKKFLYDDFISAISMLIDDMERALNLQAEERFKAFLAAFYTEALAGTLLSAITEKRNYSQQEIIEYIDMTLKCSLPQALILSDERKRKSPTSSK